MLTVLKLAQERKTVRSFSDKGVDVRDVKLALEVASQAPSGANYQPWRFLVITDPEIKERVKWASEEGEKEFYDKVSGDWAEWLDSKEINWRKSYLVEAPILVAILGENGVPYSKESVWLSIGYMLLALEEMGLATVPYTPSGPSKVLNVLDTPDGFRLEAILPIGYSMDGKPKEERMKLDKVYRLNQWSSE
jgi:nitroreductase